MRTQTIFAVDPGMVLQKRRQCFDKDWIGEGYWIQFTTPLIAIDGEKPKHYTFCYPHDLYLAWIMIGNLHNPCLARGSIKGTESWDVHGKYSMPTPSIPQMRFLIQNHLVGVSE